MRTLFRFVVAFLAILSATALATIYLGVEFGRANFWNHHGILFLIFITFFPRLTLVLSGGPLGGLVWWLGWIFVPRLLVATLATLAYWHQNPILVVISWMVALGGESSEKYAVVKRTRKPAKGYDSAKWVSGRTD